jgi:GNAT superfamily N-acetyltransferase
LLLDRHFPTTAEVHLIAVARDRHRSGVGHLLLARVEEQLRAEGAQLLSVKTLGPSDPDEGYRRTRMFYEASGFLPIEEFADLWPGNPCLLMVKLLA